MSDLPTGIEKTYRGRGRMFLIWSIEHDAWWRPHRVGYTRDLAAAGIYTDRASAEIIASANVVTVNECRIAIDCFAWPIQRIDLFETNPIPDDVTHQLLYSENDAAIPLAIRCAECGTVSFNKHDIAERYCGRCHRFHDSTKEGKRPYGQ